MSNHTHPMAVVDPEAKLGDLCKIYTGSDDEFIYAEVIGFKDRKTLLSPYQATDGISIGCKVENTNAPLMVTVSDKLLGHVLDSLGNCEELGFIEGPKVEVDTQAMDAMDRVVIDEVLSLGVKAVDGLLTIGKGQRIGIFAGSGVGKSTLINRLYGSAVREVSDRPGVTRANQWVRVSPYLEILDTPGLLWPRLDDQKAALRLSYIAAVRDDIQDTYALAISLLDDMMEMKPEAVMTRFKVEDAGLRGQALLDAVCYGRGFLLKGNQPDEERGCRVVLDEFRGGKLGRLTLERAPEAEA